MSVHIAANSAAPAEHVAANCGRRSTSCLRAFAIVAMSLASCLPAQLAIHADEEDDDVAVVVGARQFVLTEQQFDQMVFGAQQQVVQRRRNVQPLQAVQRANNVQQAIVDVQPAEMNFRQRMDAAVATEIQMVDRRVSLTDVQKKKLNLAARGDVAQFFDRATELRSKLTSKPMNQQEYVELMQKLQPLRMFQQLGSFGENSLFRKTLRHTLTEEQRVRWQTLERERQKAVIETAIQTLERTANGIMLVGETRQKFIDVLLDYGDLPESRNSYIYYVVLVEAGKLEDRLKPILTEEIWEKLQTQITQAKQVEMNLRKSGQWPERAAEDDDGLANTTKD